MSDVARKAKVSRSTVSVVLGGNYGTAHIADETRERVLQAARDLGYHRNALAQAVSTGRSYTLGFLMVGEHNEYVMLNLWGAMDEAEENGYSIKRFRLHATKEDENTIARCLEQRMDGAVVIYQGMVYPTEMIERAFKDTNVPVVWITNQDTPQLEIQVRPDDEQGIADAVHHLADIGHKSIAFLGGVHGEGTGIPRLAGFERGIREAHTPTSYVRWTDWETEKIHSALLELLEQEVKPTAIICGSDATAMLAIKKLGERELRVPQDISIIGCGNMARVGLWQPPLTTVSIPYLELGRTAVSRLLALIEGNDARREEEVVLLPSPLIVRSSTQIPSSL